MSKKRMAQTNAQKLFAKMNNASNQPLEFVCGYKAMSSLGVWMLPRALCQLEAHIDRDATLGRISHRTKVLRKKAISNMEIGAMLEIGDEVILRVPAWEKKNDTD